MQQRRQPGHVFISYVETVRPQLVQCGLHVAGVPQYDHVEHQAERTELVFLPLAVVLPQLASLAVEDGAGDAVPPLATVELSQRAPALGFVIDVGQRVQRLVDAAELGDGLGQPGRALADLERAHDAGGRNPAELERAGQAQHVVPMRLDLL